MTYPVVDTVFTQGTTITSEWLNGVNDYVNDQTASQIPYTPPFTGGVQTTVQNKLAQTVSVKDFGAVGDGVTDDTDAIQAAIDSGYAIYFPSGTYIVKPKTSIQLEGGATYCCLVAKTNMKLYGNGWGQSIIKLADNQSTDASPLWFNIIATNDVLDNVVIDNLKFDINGQNNPISPNRGSGTYNRFTCAAFICSGSVATVGTDARLDNAKFTNLWIENTPGVTCIGLAQSNQNGTVLGHNIEISGCVFYNNGLDTDDHSSIYSWAENVDIHDNTFYFPTMSSGIEGPRVACELHGARNYFHNNDVYNYPQGLWLSGNKTNPAYHQIISNNSFVVCYSAMGFTGLISAGAETLSMYDISINNNVIWLTADNTQVGVYKPAIGIFGGNFVNKVHVSDNIIFTTDTYYAYGIAATSVSASYSMGEIEIKDNLIDGFAQSIALNGTGVGNLTNCTVANNKINVKANTITPTNTFGISVADSSTTLSLNINNNIIYSDTNQLYYGINLPALATFTNLYMDNNDISYQASVRIVDAGTVSGHRQGKQATLFYTLPAQSTWSIGDKAYCSDVTQYGSAGNRYQIYGWTRITNGTGNVLNTDWYQNRVLTGN